MMSTISGGYLPCPPPLLLSTHDAHLYKYQVYLKRKTVYRRDQQHPTTWGDTSVIFMVLSSVVSNGKSSKLRAGQIANWCITGIEMPALINGY